jgi:hypothetical protein
LYREKLGIDSKCQINNVRELFAAIPIDKKPIAKKNASIKQFWCLRNRIKRRLEDRRWHK